MRKRYISILIFIIAFSWAAAAQEEGSSEKLTKAQVIEKLSTSDFIKKKIGDLFNWGVGYDITKINRTNLAPTIKDISIVPGRTPPDERTVISLTVKVDDPGGLANIRGVRADLSSIGRLPNMMLVDDGLWGDERPNDGMFTLQASVARNIERGSKDIPVAVSNKKGWVAIGKTSVDIEINPNVVQTSASPRRVRADGSTKVKLTAKIDNPGRIQDMRSVTVDLSPINDNSAAQMYDDGTSGDETAGDAVFTLETAVKTDARSGDKKLRVTAVNLIGGRGTGDIDLTVE